MNKNSQIETEEQLAERNKTITGSVKDDLRRFVGEYTAVTDNFICFGTTDQTQCKNNMDTYMYRIIGVGSHNRLKLIKATKIEKDSAKIFQWDNSNSDVKWNNSDLYKGINGMSGSGNYFKENSKYSYMSQTHWTNLIDPTTYYIGDSTSKTNSQSFVEERKEHFDNGKISLMYLSDYLYADSSSQNGTRGYTDNWLFIQNGLNGDTSNLGNGATAPTAEAEWTMTRCDYDGDFYHARIVYYDGTVDYDYVGASSAIRPVFYLKSTTRISDGGGTIGDPYMIAN